MKLKRILSGILAAMMIATLYYATAPTSLADDTEINYTSTITVGTYPDFVTNHQAYSSYCLIIDNYNDYVNLGFEGKNESFFNDNLLLINYIFNGMGVEDAYENTGVVINDNSSITVSYFYDASKLAPFVVEYAIDTIEFKKSDVNDLDLTKESVNVETKYHDGTTENKTINMKHIKIDLPKDDKIQTTTTPTTQKPTKPTVKKPAKVTKVKLKLPKKKQLRVTWKKIKGAKYQVQYSLKKNMKKANLKNTKKNKIVLKKLKSNKKYYVRVRAYKTVNGKKYFGKWSKKSAKTVK